MSLSILNSKKIAILIIVLITSVLILLHNTFLTDYAAYKFRDNQINLERLATISNNKSVHIGSSRFVHLWSALDQLGMITSLSQHGTNPEIIYAWIKKIVKQQNKPRMIFLEVDAHILIDSIYYKNTSKKFKFLLDSSSNIQSIPSRRSENIKVNILSPDIAPIIHKRLFVDALNFFFRNYSNDQSKDSNPCGVHLPAKKILVTKSWQDLSENEKIINAQKRVTFFELNRIDEPSNKQFHFLEKTLELLVKNKITPVLIKTPIVKEYRELRSAHLMKKINQRINDFVQKYDLELLDLSEELDQDSKLFLNQDHVNYNGSLEIAPKLIETLCRTTPRS